MAGKTRGRQKIQMAKMSKESNLLVTFSKRRTGLFKKASELCTLCGAEIAIIVFSPGKKVFSFGHPAVDSIIDRYLAARSSNADTPPGATTAMQLVEAHRVACVRELNMYMNDMVGELEAEKRRGEEVRQLRKATHGVGWWWEAPVEEMGLKELEQLKAAMEELRNNVRRQVGKMEAEKVVVVESSLFPPVLGVGEGGFIGDNKAPAATGIGQLSVTPQGYTLVFGQPLFIGSAVDTLFWRYDSKGKYSVRDGYRLQRGLFEPPVHQSEKYMKKWWKFLWKLSLPPKIRIFWWNLAHDIIPANLNLLAHHVPVTGACNLCHFGSDSTCHSVFFCAALKNLWKDTPWKHVMKKARHGCTLDFCLWMQEQLDS